MASSAASTSSRGAWRQAEHGASHAPAGQLGQLRLVGWRTEDAELDGVRVVSDPLARGGDLGELVDRMASADRHPAVAELGDVRGSPRSGVAAQDDRGGASAPASATTSSARSTRARPRTTRRRWSTAASSPGCSRAGSPASRCRRCRAGPSPPCSIRTRRRTGSARSTARRRWPLPSPCGSDCAWCTRQMPVASFNVVVTAAHAPSATNGSNVRQ